MIAGAAHADLVALYQFDETSGDIAHDASVNDGIQHAVLNEGAVGWQPAGGVVGGAIDLDGVTSLVAADALGEGATAFTIAAWVKLDAVTGYTTVFGARNNTGNWGINLFPVGEGYTWDFRYSANNATNSKSGQTGEGTVDVGSWQHVAMTWNANEGSPAGGFGSLYIDGEFAQFAPGGIENEYDAAGTQWYISQDPGYVRQMDGLLDELAVWNEQLTDEDIMAIYTDGLAGTGITAPPRIGLPGDVNGDTKVNTADFNTILQNLFQEFTETSEGDLINDDFVDFIDYGDWKQVSPKDPDPSATASGGAAPEPCTALLLALGSSFVTLQRRR